MAHHRASPPPASSLGRSVNGWNAEYLDDLYRQWTADPASVEPEWRSFFEGFDLGVRRPAPPASTKAAKGGGTSSELAEAHEGQWRVANLIYHYRDLGHLAADLDPLGTTRPRPARLALEAFGLSEADLDREFDPGLLPLKSPATLREIVQLLEDTYCRTVGVEYMHIQDTERRQWLQSRMETFRNRPEPKQAQRLRLLDKLIEADGFESFLRTRYVGKKRFGLEGGESLIPMLDTIVENAPAAGVGEIVMGMAHRGRLNVLVNVLHKTFDQIFTEFEELWQEDFIEGGGDVKYHSGYSIERKTDSGGTVKLALAPNPSHLEFVDAIVLGRTRAKQRLAGDAERRSVVPLVMHGDAAFAGQGIVAECFNMMRLDGYDVGGTLHIVINNQLGFTTNQTDSFSGVYCTDVAKMVDCPIFHVNGDDPEACAWVAKLALEYRQAFGVDVVIDFWCYRRHGHNEADEPRFTQPLMYKRIKAQKPVIERYRDHLVELGVITLDDFKATSERLHKAMDEAQTRSKSTPVDPSIDPFRNIWEGLAEDFSWAPVDTAVDEERLATVARALGHGPEGHTLHRTIGKILAQRGAIAEAADAMVDWGAAEQLAFGTLLLEGISVRLTGQDVERGTFSHRHSVIRCQESGEDHVPLNAIAPGQGRYCVHNSPLTETACVGFEYGYSLADPRMLIVWEAQFGDFVNGAQVIIDQFIASAEAKWQRCSGLVLSLPHGYEGQGPEHSSARLERFLQLCAGGNMIVCVPTTSAQIFHLYRRQMHQLFRKPLIVMSPKSMLRSPAAASPRRELLEGRFEPVLDDPRAADRKAIRRVLLCCGKIYHELDAARMESGEQAVKEVAIVRVEQLNPFPGAQLQAILETFPNVEELVWVQEEPKNQGAFRFVQAQWLELTGNALGYVGRPESPSPAVGSTRIHAQEQGRLIADAIGIEPQNLALSEADAAGGVEKKTSPSKKRAASA
jgi:2-oxoglutarate dehydrogenase E1 component